MGMMTKMRDNAHIFIIAFAVVFILFWVVSDIDVGSIMQGSRNEIGSIGGRSITYQEFQQVVDNIVEDRRKQNKGQEMDENAVASIREQVWNDYVTRAVIDRAVEELDITVTDEEVMDWIRSDNPPEALAQYFRDSTGNFNREGYNQFLSRPGAENQKALVQLEKQLRDEITRSKLTLMLSSAVQISDQDLRTKFVDQSMQLAAHYIFFDPHIIAAKDTGKPSEDEYQAYYEKNKKQFKTKEMRKIKYVLFPEVPSATDSSSVRNELNTIVEQARQGKDFLELLKNTSEQPYQDAWYSRQQLSPQVVEKVFGKPVGSIVGPIPSETGFSLFKILEERTGTETLTEASHILFRIDGGQDEAAQRAKAEDAVGKAKAGEDFGMLAARLSEEPGAAERKGSLGWFGKGRMVPEFESAVAKAKIGEIVGPVKTQFGYHVIKVTGRSSQEIKFAEIRMAVKPSARTRDDLFEKARNFAYFAQEKGLEEEAKLDNLKMEETTEFAEQSGSFIPNIGVNSSLMKFCFDNKVGTTSEVFRAQNGYVVAQISDTRPEGFKPLEEVKEQIRSQVVFERQMQKTLQFAKSLAKPGKSLQDMAASGPGLSVVPTSLFSPSSGATGVGKDEAFIGTLLSLKPGQASKPFRGLRGVFVAQLESKSPFDEAAFKIKKDELRQQAAQQLQNEFIQAWLDQMKTRISITDNRDRFYR
jgi:peptidyl-prolyl cis-trans isomerase D